ncbi:unnamed protein product, partial [Rotaria magnacalcarata]
MVSPSHVLILVGIEAIVIACDEGYATVEVKPVTEGTTSVKPSTTESSSSANTHSTITTDESTPAISGIPTTETIKTSQHYPQASISTEKFNSVMPTIASQTTGATQETIKTSTKIDDATTNTAGTPTQEYCVYMEYIDSLIATGSVKSISEHIPNIADLMSNGVDFTDKNAVIVIDIPNDGMIIRDVKLPSNNIAEIMLTFTSVIGVALIPLRGNPTALPSHSFPNDKISNMVIQILETIDNNPPTAVTLSIVACAPGITKSKTQGTRTYTLLPTDGNLQTQFLTSDTQSSSIPETKQTQTLASTTRTLQTAISATQDKFITSFSPQCEHTQYLNRLIQTDSIKCVTDHQQTTQAFLENGVDFPQLQPIIAIDIPDNMIVITDLNITSDNVDEIMITFTTTTGVVISPIRGAPTNIDAADFPPDAIAQIVIQIKHTNDNKPPRAVKLSVIACVPGTTLPYTSDETKSGEQTTTPIRTTKPLTQSTTHDGQTETPVSLDTKLRTEQTTVFPETKPANAETTNDHETEQATKETTVVQETKPATEETTPVYETKQATEETTVVQETKVPTESTNMIEETKAATAGSTTAGEVKTTSEVEESTQGTTREVVETT